MPFRRACLCTLMIAGLATPVFSANIKAVATFSILGDIVHQIGGKAIDLNVLVGPDGDAHTFEPTPQDNVVLSKADIIFENGLHFEHWLDNLYGASGSKAKRIVVSEGVIPRHLGDDQQDTDAQQGNSPGEIDPHIWHDVSNAVKIAEAVRDGLVSVDPKHADTYTANASAYIDQLKELDMWTIATLSNIDKDNRKLVTSHDTFGYFARRYGFIVIGTALESPTTEAVDPSAKQMAELIGKIKDAGVAVVFTENIKSPKLIKTVAVETGVKVAPVLYTDALGPKGSAGDTYIKMIQYNVGVITKALTE